MGAFFVIEGLSASGKSTTFDLLKDGPAFFGIRSIPKALESARTAFCEPAHADARYLFFCSALAMTSVEIARALGEGRNVLVESYLYRTISFHRAFGATADIQWPPSLVMPDKVFFLTCSEEERRRRHTARARPRNCWDDLAEARHDRIVDQYSKWEMIKIDTQENTAEQVAARILKELNGVPLSEEGSAGSHRVARATR